jgi:uroporphyrinogen decarboxylase
MAALSHRERVLLALNHREADRVPIDLHGWACYFTEGAYRNLLEYLGIHDEPVVNDWFLVQKVSEDILKRFDVDFRRVGLGSPDGFQTIVHPDGTWTDEWGITKRKVGHYSARLGRIVYYAEMVDPPLAEASVADLETYPWPDPHDPGRYRGLAEEVRYLYENTDYALVASAIGQGIFEQAQWLRGPQQFLTDLLVNKEFALRLIEKVVEFQLAVMERYMEIVGPYVQMVETSDDYGMQVGLLISPALYREMLQPSHRRLIETIKGKTKAKVFLHSCGSISDILEDLIDAGVDVINPVQPLAKGMDSYVLKERFGDRIVFHGGIDVQRVLPYGSVEDVKQEVKHRIRAFGPGGGYILAPAHNIQDDVPPENVIAMFEAAHQYGQYPIGTF